MLTVRPVSSKFAGVNVSVEDTVATMATATSSAIAWISVLETVATAATGSASSYLRHTSVEVTVATPATVRASSCMS